MCRPPAMSADRPAASDGGHGVSRTLHPGLVSDRVPHHIPSLCFDMCAMALETWPLPGVLHAHLPATSPRLCIKLWDLGGATAATRVVTGTA